MFSNYLFLVEKLALEIIFLRKNLEWLITFCEQPKVCVLETYASTTTNILKERNVSTYQNAQTFGCALLCACSPNDLKLISEELYADFQQKASGRLL
jgi:hypothetical protein